MKEAELVQKCIAGNREAQRLLFETYAGKLSAVCRRYASNEEEARDFFQEGMIKVFTNLVNFKFQSSLETWMTRIMINTAISAYRRKKMLFESVDAHNGYLSRRLADREDEEEDENEGGVSVYEALEPSQVIEIFELLPAGYRAVLNMYVLENMSHKEIAEVLGISENTSKTQLLKARRKVRELVKKIYSVNI
jgi:RNA polymerase sigma-70 factor (ECF subfamily)